jgi:hypothetical protein
MNNTRVYICIRTQMTSTTNKDRSSNNVVKTRKTFRWNNKKKKTKERRFLCIAKSNDRCCVLFILTHIKKKKLLYCFARAQIVLLLRGICHYIHIENVCYARKGTYLRMTRKKETTKPQKRSDKKRERERD